MVCMHLMVTRAQDHKNLISLQSVYIFCQDDNALFGLFFIVYQILNTKVWKYSFKKFLRKIFLLI